jgi:hypothetical protein
MRGWSENQILADLKLRLSKKEDVNKQIKGGLTPLMSAALAGYVSVVKALLEAGADPLLKNRFNEDLIACAKLSENKEIIDLAKSAFNAKGSTKAASLPIMYFRPKTRMEAEYTFYPAKIFKAEHNATEKDLGLFLNSKEVLKLSPIKESSLSANVLTVFVKEGKVTININDWDELLEKKVTGLLDKSSVDIHGMSDIIREYLSN